MSGAMQEDITNLYYVTIVFMFQVKSRTVFFFNFADQKLVSTLIERDQPFFLPIIQSFLNFLLIPRIRAALRICRISRNFQIFKFFHFSFLKYQRHFKPRLFQTTPASPIPSEQPTDFIVNETTD